MTHFRTVQTQSQREEDPSIKFSDDLKESREIGKSAVWTLSSAKPGFGVDQLRDDNLESYWQSDGPQPHLINIQFNKKTAIEEVRIFTDHKLDESYTPCKISVRAGTNYHDLQEIKLLELEEPSGWLKVSIIPPNKNYLRANFIQVAVLQNHQNGRDTHIRQVKIFGPRYASSKLMHFKTEEFTVYSELR